MLYIYSFLPYTFPLNARNNDQGRNDQCADARAGRGAGRWSGWRCWWSWPPARRRLAHRQLQHLRRARWCCCSPAPPSTTASASERVKHVFRIVDHASIYLLIAGTYTPFLLVNLRGGWGWSLFGVVWGLALAGIVFQIFFVDRFRLAQTLIYLAMGWLVVIAVKPLLANVPRPGLLWLLAGGLCYTVGAIFYLWKKLPYHHAVWHLFVLARQRLPLFCNIVLCNSMNSRR